MQTKYLSILAAAAVTCASAGDIQRVDVVHIFKTLHVAEQVPNFSPNKRSINALFARDSDSDCQRSATSILQDVPTPTGDLARYARTADIQEDGCTFKAPSYISSALMSYYTSLADWEMDKGDDLIQFVENCASQDELEEINEEIGGVDCSGLGHVVFTAASTTQTVDLQTAFPNYTPLVLPSTIDNAAVPTGVSKFAAAAAAGVAVGISTGLSSFEEEPSEHNVFAELFHIPHLKSLYYHDLLQDREQEEDSDFDFEEMYDFPVGTSSIENLFLDSAYQLSHDFYDAIASAPEKLETIVIRAPNSAIGSLNNFDSFVRALANNNPRLERFVIYHCGGIRGHGCSSYLPEHLKDFCDVKQITITASDIELEGWFNRYDGATLKALREEWVQEAFPSNMEAMYITGRSDIYVNEFGYSETPFQILDDLLALLIKSGAYKDLKVIYLENMEAPRRPVLGDIPLGSPITARRAEFAFQKTLAEGHEAGVHVCTLTNRDDDGYWKNFPARPDRFDLKTGPWAGERPAEWKLNLYTGEWGPGRRGWGVFEGVSS